MENSSKIQTLFNLFKNMELDPPKFKEVDLSQNAFVLLRLIQDFKDNSTLVSISDLCVSLSAKKSAMSQLVSRLERKGLVKRSWAKLDRRKIVVNITAKGTAVISEYQNKAQEFMQRKLGKISEEDMDTLIAIIKKYSITP